MEFPEPGLMLRKMVCFFNLCLRRFLRTVFCLSMFGSPCSRAALCPHKALGIGFGEPEGVSSPSPASIPWVPGFSHTCLLFSAAPCCPCCLQGFEQCFLNARTHQKRLEGLADRRFCGDLGGGNGNLSSGPRVSVWRMKKF